MLWSLNWLIWSRFIEQSPSQEILIVEVIIKRAKAIFDFWGGWPHNLKWREEISNDGSRACLNLATILFTIFWRLYLLLWRLDFILAWINSLAIIILIWKKVIYKCNSLKTNISTTIIKSYPTMYRSCDLIMLYINNQIFWIYWCVWFDLWKGGLFLR